MGSILGQEEPLEKEMATHSSILAWKSHGQRNLAGYSPRGHKESDTTERLSMHAPTKPFGEPGKFSQHTGSAWSALERLGSFRGLGMCLHPKRCSLCSEHVDRSPESDG